MLPDHLASTRTLFLLANAVLSVTGVDVFRCTLQAGADRLLPGHARCDGYPDCPGGEDEMGCQWQGTNGVNGGGSAPSESNGAGSRPPTWNWSPPASQPPQWRPDSSSQWRPDPSPQWRPESGTGQWRPEQGQEEFPNWNSIPTGYSGQPYYPAGYQQQQQQMQQQQQQQQQQQLPTATSSYQPTGPSSYSQAYQNSGCRSLPLPSSCPMSGWLQPTARWYYDPSTNNCHNFQYTCGNGYNIFETEIECEMVCGPSALGYGDRPPLSIEQQPQLVPTRPNYGGQSQYNSNYYSAPRYASNTRYSSRNTYYPSSSSGSYPSSSSGYYPGSSSGSMWSSSTSAPLLTMSTFQSYLQQHDYVLVEFFAKWCQTCVDFQPSFERAANQLKQLGVHCGKVNIDQEPELRKANNVTNFPTILLWMRGENSGPRVYYKGNGLTASSLVNWVRVQLDNRSLGQQSGLATSTIKSMPAVTTTTTRQTVTPPSTSAGNAIRTTTPTSTPSQASESFATTTTAMSYTTTTTTTTTTQQSWSEKEDNCYTDCDEVYRPICGSDNRTYNNTCLYNMARCRDPLLYVVAGTTCSASPAGQATCRRTEFMCKSDRSCLSYLKVCNNKLDCLDGSDEASCFGCSKSEFTCKSGSCIDYGRRCDGIVDCKDISDELGCPKICTDAEFTCNDGSCISQQQRCDGVTNCEDFTDEIGCDNSGCNVEKEFVCEDRRQCVLKTKRCDGYPDCSDVSDEQNCPFGTCNSQWMFQCNNSTQCIDSRRRCDGYVDCSDRSDEQGCRDVECLEWQFKCEIDGICIHKFLQCNSVQDCRDGSDEESCGESPSFSGESLGQTPTLSETVSVPETEYTEQTEEAGGWVMVSCSGDNSTWNCKDDKYCIDVRRRCDGVNDCSDGSDEQSCAEVECNFWQIKCKTSGICIHKGLQCDGELNCEDGTDEVGCGPTATEELPPPTDQPPLETTTEVFVTLPEDEEDIFGFAEDAAREERLQLCRMDCQRILIPVCGSDGKTYENKCILEEQACIEESDVLVAYSGNCEEDTASQIDSCPQFCPQIFRPVCGTDGVTYSSECDLRQSACAQAIQIEVQNDGDCGECQLACPEAYLPVCGSDGVTYSNECLLNCTTQGNLTVAYNGPCLTGEASSEGGGEFPTDPRQPSECGVAEECDPVFMPVCGSDGVTYDNLCLLQLAACVLNSPQIIPVYTGDCRDDGTEDEFEDLFSETTTDFYDGLLLLPEEGSGESTGDIVCPTFCPVVFAPVCGSNNVTYSSQCNLRSAECRENMVILKLYDGECGAGQPEPACALSCLSPNYPVCGSDRTTYASLCDMERASCKTRINITLLFEGRCEDCNPNLEWMCGDNTCVSATALCDGTKDCPDASDEDFCTFTCNDGENIDIKKHCDNFPDCFSGEDENNCANFPMNAAQRGDQPGSDGLCDQLDQYRCKDHMSCIDKSKLCDGTVDCPFEDDEFDCKEEYASASKVGAADSDNPSDDTNSIIPSLEDDITGSNVYYAVEVPDEEEGDPFADFDF